MNEDIFNMSVRKFLKKVGISSQREIEHMVLKKIESGELKGNEVFNANVTLEISDLGLKTGIDGKIELE